jgi:hypothetical protein
MLDLTDIYLLRQSIENIINILNAETAIKFNRNNGRLYLDFDIESMLDRFIIIQCQRALDPVQFAKIYNDRFVKEYFAILVKIQFGQNLRKFSNIQLPSGVMFNADSLYNDGVREKEAFLAKMSSEWEEYPIFMIG